jgi:hypothetical protein
VRPYLSRQAAQGWAGLAGARGKLKLHAEFDVCTEADQTNRLRAAIACLPVSLSDLGRIVAFGEQISTEQRVAALTSAYKSKLDHGVSSLGDAILLLSQTIAVRAPAHARVRCTLDDSAAPRPRRAC